MEASEFYSFRNNCSKKAINANISNCCRLKKNKCQAHSNIGNRSIFLLIKSVFTNSSIFV